ncbi:hypothetical protein PR048_032949 [Dryococelus australis]|uniref:Uncharacterized protein n=1 Tax=Dryococelus australis TaxID=614101 RepID=A0ABQ9G6K8_9NEOP|nr:hypothetical protein PR048_032949 [Dryococelus australis]
MSLPTVFRECTIMITTEVLVTLCLRTWNALIKGSLILLIDQKRKEYMFLIKQEIYYLNMFIIQLVEDTWGRKK